jgi:SAM-dependent methyltransferase
LVETCLEKLLEAFEVDDNIGFVYSDDAVMGPFTPYPADFGWTHKCTASGLMSMNSFEPSSQSLGFIWYAPDHVRSWRRTVYEAVGGHNEDLSVCDDHELMIRTYLTTEFKRVPEVLYIYRITGENTWIQRNADIQKITVDLFNKYARQLAERDAELRGLLKIDLGGGICPLPGYTTLDTQDADILCNLEDGIPLPDNSVGVINASHVLEHLRDPIKSMREIHRVLAHGGWAFIEVPSTEGRGAWQDPTHVSYWNENSFLYYTHRDFAKFIRNTEIRFQSFRCETHYPSQWWETLKCPVVSAWLVAVKDSGDRLPHTLTI